MPKQADFDRINRLVMVPLATFYAAKFPEGLMDAMVEDLAAFDDDTLTAAVVDIRRTCKTTPRIAHLVEACRRLGGSGHRSENDGTAYAALMKREDDARGMARRFMDQFQLTPLARKARDEGWEWPLLQYVYEAAWLQAQHITRACNPGYSLIPLTNGRKLEADEIDRRIHEFKAFCKRQAGTGTIEVSVPSYLIEEWKPKEQAA